MRSIYKGTISWGLVNVPVKLYGAIEDHDVKAHQVHAGDGGKIRYKRVCEDCGELVEYADIAKAYDYGDEKVILTTDDLQSIAEEANRIIDVLEFVPERDIDPLMWEKPYFLAPDESDKAYKLLAETLANVERVAMVKFSMRGKTRLAALRVTGKENVIVAHTLLWPDEVRDHNFFTLKDVKITDTEMNLAEQLVDSLANEFNADRYRDEYQEQLRELIEAKANGEEITPAEERKAEAEVLDLLAQLQASVNK